MPVCPQCDNRAFANKEALLQHMRSSSAWHPFCTTCDRRFVSQTAYEAHMAAKHPPTYDCTLCNRPYHAPFALEDHYRGSAAHPNCTKCGRGFLNQAACDEHRQTGHPTTICIPCDRQIVYVEELPQHYHESKNHPSCLLCQQGFKDNEAYAEHLSTLHPEPSQESLEDPRQNEHIQESVAVIEGSNETSPSAFNPPQSIELNEIQRPRIHDAESPVYSTGFTPLSPRNPIQTLIIGERRIHTPDLLANIGYTSPLINTQLPLLTPTSLPRPGAKIDELWSSRENKQVTSPRNSYFVPATPRDVDPYTRPYHSHREAGSSSSAWSDYTVRSALRPREGRMAVSPPRISPPRSEFDPRLYPGSLRANSLHRLSGSPPEASFARGGASYLDDFRGGQSRRSVGGASSVGSASHSSFGRSRESISDPINWRELMGGSSGQDSSFASSSNIRASLFSETLTPRADVAESNSPTPVRLTVQAQNLNSSPSLATASISSPASSALGRSPGSLHFETDTRPTTASSSHTPSFNDVLYTITPSSECGSPHSPEVNSPFGLMALPSISPLASTPTDIPGFDIPEAHQPLPASPTDALSPVTVVIELSNAIEEPEPQPQEVPAPSTPAPHSPLSTSSTQTYITSPQNPTDLHIHIDHEAEEQASILEESANSGPPSPAVRLSAALLTSEPATPIASTSPKTTNANPLHCRACLADSCDDITASMCGHIFCNRCIVDAVIKTSRCPVCMTPTLLYCLFRLDLAA